MSIQVQFLYLTTWRWSPWSETVALIDELIDGRLGTVVEQSFVFIADGLCRFQLIHQTVGKCRDVLLMAFSDVEIALQLIDSSRG